MNLEDIDTAVGVITVARPEAGDSCGAYLRAEIGTLEGVVDRGEFVKSALRGNFFYRHTDGAVLSLDEADRVQLTLRCEEASLADGTAKARLIDGFAPAVRVWRELLAAAKISEGKEG